jgi:hypothetical protein
LAYLGSGRAVPSPATATAREHAGAALDSGANEVRRGEGRERGRTWGQGALACGAPLRHRAGEGEALAPRRRRGARSP